MMEEIGLVQMFTGILLCWFQLVFTQLHRLISAGSHTAISSRAGDLLRVSGISSTGFWWIYVVGEKKLVLQCSLAINALHDVKKRL